MRNFYKTKAYILIILIVIFQGGVMCTSNTDKARESQDTESSIAGSPDTDLSETKKLKSGEVLQTQAELDFNQIIHASTREGLVSVFLTISPILREGSIIGYMVQTQDITERKKAEEKVRESEEKYRGLFDSSPDGIISMDNNGVVTSVNEAVLYWTGFAKDEILGKHFTKLGVIRASDVPKYVKIVSSTMRGKKPGGFEVVYIYKDGTQRFAEAHISLMKEMGKGVGVQVILRDITERKRAEEQLKESEKKYRGLFENAHEVIVLIDLEGKVTSINKAAVSYGLKKDEVVGKNITKFVSKKD